MDVTIGALAHRRLRVFGNRRFIAAYTLGSFRPYVYPLHTPSGLPVTEESPPDHPHHQSVWLGQDETGGHNFWLNRPGGPRLTGEPPLTELVETPDGPAALFRHEIAWVTGDGAALLRESRVTAITLAPGATLVDVVSERTPADGPVTLGATKEAGFGVRVADALDELDGGVIVDSHGRRAEAGTFDQHADWVDCSGRLGDRAVGVALFPHPDNPRHPWFTRAYGILLSNPHRFGPQTLQPGETLRLQWRVAAHDGDAAGGRVAALHSAYLAACRGGLREALAWHA